MTFPTRRAPFRTLAAVIALWGSFIGHAAAQSLTPPADRALLQSIAGEYHAGTIVMTVTLLEDGTLTLLFPGQQLYHLDPVDSLHYRIRELAPGYGIDFLRDASGAITGITVHQPPPQQDFSAARKGAPAAASAAPQITDRRVLESLAGDYQAGTIVMTVTLLEDGTLTLLFPGQQLYHLDPQGGPRYRIRELAPGFGIDFLGDASGAITGITVHQPPPQQDFSATRKSDQVNARVGTTPAPAASASLPGVAAPEPGVERVTLVEGPSFELPSKYRPTEAHNSNNGGTARTTMFRAGNGNVLFRLKHGFPQSGLELPVVRSSVAEEIRTGKMKGVLSDLDLPGAQAFAVGDDQTGSEQVDWYYWVRLANMVWAFECTELALTERGMCASTMRSFQIRPGTEPPARR